MKLVELIPDVDALCALEPEELGLRMLTVIASQPHHENIDLNGFLMVVKGHGPVPPQYPPNRIFDVELAIRESWAWLEGSAPLIQHSRFGHSSRC